MMEVLNQVDCDQNKTFPVKLLSYIAPCEDSDWPEDCYWSYRVWIKSWRWFNAFRCCPDHCLKHGYMIQKAKAFTKRDIADLYAQQISCIYFQNIRREANTLFLKRCTPTRIFFSWPLEDCSKITLCCTRLRLCCKNTNLRNNCIQHV